MWGPSGGGGPRHCTGAASLPYRIGWGASPGRGPIAHSLSRHHAGCAATGPAGHGQGGAPRFLERHSGRMDAL